MPSRSCRQMLCTRFIVRVASARRLRVAPLVPGRARVAAGYRDAAPLSRRALAAVARRELAVYRDAAGIFTLSDRVRRSFIDDFGLPEDRVHTILAGPNFPEDRTPGRK